MKLHIVILAAGKGTRMRSRRPKVLQTLAGRPLLAHVLDTARRMQPEAIHVVIGHGAAQVCAAFPDAGVQWVEQVEQKGTGHAVQCAMPNIPTAATVLVLYGDVPLVSESALVDLAQAGQRQLAILTANMDDPTGYGRIVRNSEQQVQAIVEQKDASAAQRALCEVNTGFIAAPAAALQGWLAGLGCDNAQGEYYLTDCVAASVQQGGVVHGVRSRNVEDTLGVNDRRQLAQLERIVQRRQADQLMQGGLQLLDPERLDLRGTLEFGQDCQIDVNCVIEGQTVLGDDVYVGPNCVLRNVRIGSGSRIEAFTHIDGAELDTNVQVGPYARLRPGTRLARGAKVGNFVETKQTVVGPGSKINHLSYVGDAVLGADVNVGAGTITCNYDGANKHRTVIGDGAFIGSNSALVAPVRIGAGATIGAGSTISREAPERALTVARARQKSLPGWQRPQKKPRPESS
ncbi:MAG: bifunctional UDP-N-acetylglucosamine diphosphorylase/glucosamine-1-phosphate N-acetyltransferase GlmU [Oceanococcaceae bacterium]